MLCKKVLIDKLGVLGDIESFKSIPIRGVSDPARYMKTTYLEFVARTLCGVAPLIEIEGGNSSLFSLEKIHIGLGYITDKTHPHYLNFTDGTQPLVDSALLALAFMRAPFTLWYSLPNSTKDRLVRCLLSTRSIKPHFNNWLLFSATIEAFFCKVGLPFDKVRIDYALKQHEQWYLGDGQYSDGIHYRADYYNSFVILPLLLEICETVRGYSADWDKCGKNVLFRCQRHAEILERLISPEGYFPPIGRSLSYRAAAFHLLAQLALKEKLPDSLHPGQVRAALEAVIKSTLVDDTNYDEQGWLRIGLNGNQPKLGEDYISTGSLYLTSVVFLPLGLSDRSEFWSSQSRPWTQRKLWWFGDDIGLDKARD